MDATTQLQTALDALQDALVELTAPHVPEGEELKHLEQALFHLIAARDLRDFEGDEEAVWNCGSIKIAGVDRGGWEIRLTPHLIHPINKSVTS